MMLNCFVVTFTDRMFYSGMFGGVRLALLTSIYTNVRVEKRYPLERLKLTNSLSLKEMMVNTPNHDLTCVGTFQFSLNGL